MLDARCGKIVDWPPDLFKGYTETDGNLRLRGLFRRKAESSIQYRVSLLSKRESRTAIGDNGREQHSLLRGSGLCGAAVSAAGYAGETPTPQRLFLLLNDPEVATSPTGLLTAVPCR